MPYNTTITLDQISASQAAKEATANALFAAMSPAALFGIKTSATSGLNLTLYGGNMLIAGEPTPIATQTVALTASTTNYIYATSSGVVTKTTSAPSGWPGPLAAGAVALYQLAVGGSTITSGTSYLVGIGATGSTGAQGDQGPEGSDFVGSRKRLYTTIGAGSTSPSVIGMDTWTSSTLTARSLATTSLRESIPYAAIVTAAGAGSSVFAYNPRITWFLGNAAGRGGFTVGMRWCYESTSSPATQRSWIGMQPAAALGNVEPDSILNAIGVGALAGDANLSVIHNDGSGTATKVALGANFPARATDNVYELVLDSAANSGVVSYTLTNINSGNVASGTISTDLPANTQFMSCGFWINNGSTASVAAMGLMQVVGESRY